MLVSKCAKACDECKRRKRRCQGGTPCTWCLSHNIFCSLQNDVNNNSNNSDSDNNNDNDIIIRTHKKKHKNNNYNEQVFVINTQAINTLAQELGVNFELSKYYTYFSYNVPVTMLTGVNWNYIESAEGLSNKFIKYAVCALTARACGNMKHSDSLISDAMRLCKTLTDEISLSSLTGFMLIYVYFLSFDPPLAKTYADIAFKIFHQLSKSKQALPVTTTTSLELYHSIMTPSQNEFEKSQKIDSFLSKTIDTALSTKDAYLEFVVTQMRLVAKFLGHSKSNELHGVRIDILTILDCHMEFTESQRDDVITEVEACRNLLQNIPNRRQYYSIDICEMIVNWRSGKTAIALAAAKQFAETVVIDSFLLGTHFEVEHLLLVTMILYDSLQYPLAQKLFEMACLLHPRVRPICSLSDSVDPIVQFMTHNISFSSLLSANDLPADPALLSSIVKNMLSLCSPFLVSGPNSLLSPHGMSILFKSLISLCPPSPSKYNLFPLAHVPSNSSYSPQAFLLPESPLSLSSSPSPSSSSLSTSPSPSSSCYSLSPSPSPSSPSSLSSSQQTVATQHTSPVSDIPEIRVLKFEF